MSRPPHDHEDKWTRPPTRRRPAADIRRLLVAALETTRPTSKTDVYGDPLPGRGLLHALVIAIAALTPFAYAVSAQVATAVDGFRVLVMVFVTVGAGVVAAIVSVTRPLPGVAEILLRVGAGITAALVIRFSFPTPPAAWESFRAGDTRLFSATFLTSLFLLLVATVVGHSLATFVGWLATRAPTRQAAQQRARRAIAIWWLAMLVLSMLSAATAAGGPAGAWLVVAAGLVTFVVLGDLRLRTPPPPGRRNEPITSPSRTGWAVTGIAMVVALGLAVLALPVVPFDALGSLITPAWLDWLHTDRTGDSIREGLLTWPWPEMTEATGGVRGRLVDVGWGERIVALLMLLLLMRVLRMHGFRAMLRRVRRRLRRRRLDTTLEDREVEADEISADELVPARLRALIERLRGRPRDPRAAVLHDYRHIERLLDRQERGRAGYETPHEHAVRVHVSAQHEELADLAADARFARRPPDEAAVERAIELRQQIERLLRERRTRAGT